MLANLASAKAADAVRYDPHTHVAVGSSGCGSTSPYSIGTTTAATATYGGIKYAYRVYVPSNYNPNTPMPLVTQHHGWGLSAKSEERGSGISIYAEEYGYIAVYPQGSDDNTHSGGPWYSWNAVGSTQSPGPNGPTCTEAASYPSYCYTSCASSSKDEEIGNHTQSHAPPPKPSEGTCQDSPQCWWTTCHDEVTPSGTGTSQVNGFVPSLYDTLEAQLCIDTTREFAAGESNGGMMTYQLGVDMASRLAAIVPEFGSFHEGFALSPSSSVPILEFHGTKDTTVPANVSLSGDGYYYTTVEEIYYGGKLAEGWRKANGCSGSPAHYPTSFDGQFELYCSSTGSCTGGDVVRCSWRGGHNWFGNNPTANGGLVSEFLMKWSKPSHIGFGRVQGEERGEGELLEDITILENDEEEPNTFADLPVTLTPSSTGHYGNPRISCRNDEEEIEFGDDSSVCMPIISSKANDVNGVPVPNCKVGGSSPVEDNGCPNDAQVSPNSKAFPVCLGKGHSADPYLNSEFHCVLVCPCTLGADGLCTDDSHSHCPTGASCVLGELRHRGQGVCSFSKSTSINV